MDSNIKIFFGNKQDNLQSDGVYKHENFEALREKLGVQTLFFLKQVHGNVVHCLDCAPNKDINIFEYEGDAIITNIENVGIGVVTADCLPILIVDNKHPAVAAIHAGWKGLSLKIITKTIQKMHRYFKTDIQAIKIYMGPSAESCCYEVQADFLPHFGADIIDSNRVLEREGKLFFSPLKTALLELKSLGISNAQIDFSQHRCTICNMDFCSYRREKSLAGRMPSVAFVRRA